MMGKDLKIAALAYLHSLSLYLPRENEETTKNIQMRMTGNVRNIK